MGAVFEAEQEPIGRRVALKVLHGEFAKSADATARFMDEARATNLVGHPSLVHISDYGQQPDGTAFLVMEMLAGESLGDRLGRLHRKGQRLPNEEVLSIGWQIAAALSAVHAHNIVHRDLKPDNVMLVRDDVAPGGERVKILDFGIAKLAEKSTKKTATQAVMGTPIYMSPEQCRGAGYVDAKTDVYSLGVVLFEMLAGQVPFIAEGAGELIGMHLFRAPPRLAERAPGTPTQIAALVDSLLVKDAEHRPAMAQVAAALHALAGTSRMHPLQHDRLSCWTKRGLRNRWPAIALSGLLFCGSLVVLVRRERPPSTVLWTIDTEPQGAEIKDAAGTILGKTPWQHRHTAADAGRRVLTVQRPGYIGQQLDLKLDQEEHRLIRLVPHHEQTTSPGHAPDLKQRSRIEYEE